LAHILLKEKVSRVLKKQKRGDVWGQIEISIDHVLPSALFGVWKKNQLKDEYINRKDVSFG
jgi:hypothetical protein